MDEAQALEQLAYLLRQRVWVVGGVSGTTYVFQPEAVRISPVDVIPAGMTRFPRVMLNAGGGENDGQNAKFDRIRITARLVCANPGDPLLEGAMKGARRVSATKSANRGILEVQRQLFSAIARLHSGLGIVPYGRADSSAQTKEEESVDGGVMREYVWELKVMSDPFYHRVSRLVGVGGVGSFSATWTLPPDRFDRYKIRAFRSAAGGSAPVHSGGGVFTGTEIVLASDLATSLASGVVAAGTYAISVFAAYDDFCEVRPGVYTRATERSWSAAASYTGIVVT